MHGPFDFKTSYLLSKSRMTIAKTSLHCILKGEFLNKQFTKKKKYLLAR